MRRRDLARYHDIAASTKTRGEGIGFAGVGIKMALLVCREVLTETRQRGKHVATTWALASRHRAPWKWVSAARARRRARDGGAPHRGQCALAAARPGLRRDRAPAPLRAAVRPDASPRSSATSIRPASGSRSTASGSSARAAWPRKRPDRRSARAAAQAVRGRLPDPRPGAAARGSARARDQHARQGHQARLGLARPHARRSGARGRADRGSGARGVPHAEQDRLHPRRARAAPRTWPIARRSRRWWRTSSPSGATRPRAASASGGARRGRSSATWRPC